MSKSRTAPYPGTGASPAARYIRLLAVEDWLRHPSNETHAGSAARIEQSSSSTNPNKGDVMRSPTQLIDELEYEAKAVKKLESGEQSRSGVGLVFLVGGDIEIIYDNDGNRNENIARLNDLISEQGEPVAKIAAVGTKSEMTLYAVPLIEFESDPRRPEFMKFLIQVGIIGLEMRYHPITVQHSEGWIS